MASLLIRDLDEDVKARLRVQAAEHGRSMEAEARAILAAATGIQAAPTRGLASFLRDQLTVSGVELEIPPRHDPARSVDFDE